MVATQRRTQQERTAETREALLDATIDCLAEVGYAGTTTRLVAERAGVSRGAQTHHYPTKTELVTAAIGHLFDRQAAHFREAFTAQPPGERTLDHAVDILWGIVSGPAYAAVLEVTVAGRTDPELRVVVHAMATVLESTVLDIQREFFPEVDDDGLARTIVDLAFTLMQGAAISTYGGYGDPERTIRLVRGVAALVTPDTISILKGAIDAIDR